MIYKNLQSNNCITYEYYILKLYIKYGGIFPRKASYAKLDRKQQSRFDWDYALTVTKNATLLTVTSTGLCCILLERKRSKKIAHFFPSTDIQYYVFTKYRGLVLRHVENWVVNGNHTGREWYGIWHAFRRARHVH